MVKIKTQEEFNSFITENDKCVVKLGAPWCGPCRLVADNIQQVENEMPEAKFCDIDVEEADTDFVDGFHVRNIQVLIVYNNGTEVTRSVGLKTVEELKGFFKN